MKPETLSTRHRASVLVVLAMLVASQSLATTFVPMPVEDLARSSEAVVIGTVQHLIAVKSHTGIVTLITVALDDVVSGAFAGSAITLKEDGGVVGNQRETVWGAPTFEVGERVLLFLTLRADGSLRTNHLALGKFRIELDANGMPQATQRFAPGTELIVLRGTVSPRSAIPLGEVLSSVRAQPCRLAAARTRLRIEPLEASDPSLPQEVTEAFMLLGPTRFFEADEGTPLSFLIDERGDSILGLDASRQAVDDAFNQWTDVATASIALQDGDLTDDLSTLCPGPNKIVFDDPDGTIPDPTFCHGVLGLGSSCMTSFDSKHFNGKTFSRSLRAKVTFANGWDGCSDVWTACNLAEIATHEIGHTIGLGHSSENPSEANPLLQDATMYFKAHFDGRCASVRSDDIAGLTLIYPTSTPPTITTASPLPQGTSDVFYLESLTATGGTGTFTWSLVGGGFPGLSVNADGIVSGTPGVGGTGFLQVKATDANGDSHTKVLNIFVSGPTATVTRTATRTPTRTPTSPVTVTPTPTATAPNTSTPTPSPSETVTDTPTVTPTETPVPIPSATMTAPPTATPLTCVGDCDRSGTVTVDELLTMVNIALGSAAADTCLAGDTNGDGMISVDEILTAVNAALHGCPLA